MKSQKKHKLARGDNAHEFTSTDFVENTLGHRIPIKRFDPQSVEHLSLSLHQIMELEEHGEVLTRVEDDADDIIITVVRRALLRLPKIERVVLEKFYTQGHTVNEIATALNLVTGVTANNIRLRAVSHFETLFIEEKRKSGITADYNCCPICDDPNIDALEERIYFWLDQHEHRLRGLVAELERQFGIKITQAKLTEHIEYHMVLSGDSVEMVPGAKKTNVQKMQALNLVIPAELKAKIEQIAFPYNISFSEAVRQALQLGAVELQHLLDHNENLKRVQLESVRLLARIRI